MKKLRNLLIVFLVGICFVGSTSAMRRKKPRRNFGFKESYKKWSDVDLTIDRVYNLRKVQIKQPKTYTQGHFSNLYQNSPGFFVVCQYNQMVTVETPHELKVGSFVSFRAKFELTSWTNLFNKYFETKIRGKVTEVLGDYDNIAKLEVDCNEKGFKLKKSFYLTWNGRSFGFKEIKNKEDSVEVALDFQGAHAELDDTILFLSPIKEGGSIEDEISPINPGRLFKFSFNDGSNFEVKYRDPNPVARKLSFNSPSLDDASEELSFDNPSIDVESETSLNFDDGLDDDLDGVDFKDEEELLKSPLFRCLGRRKMFIISPIRHNVAKKLIFDSPQKRNDEEEEDSDSFIEGRKRILGDD